MKTNLILALLVSYSTISFSQNDTLSNSIKSIIQYFQSYPGLGNQLDTITADSLYRNHKNSISISKAPMDFEFNEIVLPNPYYSEKLDIYFRGKYTKNYPISYSVIHNDRLIALMRTGQFVCYHLDNYERDTIFEQQLNTTQFQYHWIIDGKLSARSSKILYSWNDEKEKWTISTEKFPIRKKPKLFEDDDFIVHCDCHGEWGGTVYFYDKISKKTHISDATCANTVFKTDSGYVVIAHMAHMFGSSDIKIIPNPRLLKKVWKYEISKTKNGHALGYTDQSNAYTTQSFFEVLIVSSFKNQGRQLYFIEVMERNYFAELKGSDLQIVHLFPYHFYTGSSVTTPYGEYILMNFNHYGTSKERESGVVIIHNNQITRIDWNEKSP